MTAPKTVSSLRIYYPILNRPLAVVLTIFQIYLGGDNWSRDIQQFLASLEKR
jgi:hypothetical protein